MRRSVSLGRASGRPLIDADFVPAGIGAAQTDRKTRMLGTNAHWECDAVFRHLASAKLAPAGDGVQADDARDRFARIVSRLDPSGDQGTGMTR
jgi:hypothetical protein